MAMSYDAKTHARIGDPSTSKAAAESIEDLVKSFINIIYMELKNNGSGTYEELARRCKLRPDQVWRRLSDMGTYGYATPTGYKRKGSSGRYQRVWMAVR
jgi:hypothetical protein